MAKLHSHEGREIDHELERGDAPTIAPGKRTLTATLQRRAAPVVQRRADGAAAPDAGPRAAAPMTGDDPFAFHVPGAGDRLPGAVQAKMESSFGADFSDVRVHQGAQAAAMGAVAYAQGSQLHFAPGHYDPASAKGQELIGHELAHVVQQREGRVSAPQGKGAPINDDAGLEREADEQGARAARGEVQPRASTAAAASAGSVIQGYRIHKENLDYRVSRTERIVVTGGKTLFSDASALEEANQKLAAAGGVGGGAFLKLVATDEVNQDFPELKGVKPVRSDRQTKQVASPGETTYRQSYVEDNAKTQGGYISHSDCHLTSQTIMGSDDDLSGKSSTEKPVLQEGFLSNEDTVDESIVEPRKGPSKNVANRGKDAVLARALPRFADMLQKAVDEAQGEEAKIIQKYKTVIQVIRTVPRPAKDENDFVKLARIYKENIVPDPLLMKMFSLENGLNSSAAPEIGDALAQVNDEKEKKDEDSKDPNQNPRDLWNFHWAGVIMKDEEDYVTLENLSVEKPSENNTNWYVKMYGPEEQSFHEEAKRDPHVGSAPMTMTFRATEQPVFERPKVQPPNGPKPVKFWPLEKTLATALADESMNLQQVGVALQQTEGTLEGNIKGLAKKLGFTGAAEDLEALRKEVVKLAREKALL